LFGEPEGSYANPEVQKDESHRHHNVHIPDCTNTENVVVTNLPQGNFEYVVAFVVIKLKGLVQEGCNCIYGQFCKGTLSKNGKVHLKLQSGTHTFFKCVLCDFAHVSVFDVHLLQTQLCCANLIVLQIKHCVTERNTKTFQIVKKFSYLEINNKSKLFSLGNKEQIQMGKCLLLFSSGSFVLPSPT